MWRGCDIVKRVFVGESEIKKWNTGGPQRHRAVLSYDAVTLQTYFHSPERIEDQLFVFITVNPSFKSLKTDLYQSTAREQNCFVWPVFSSSPYLLSFTVVVLFQQGLPCCRQEDWTLLTFWAWFVWELKSFCDPVGYICSVKIWSVKGMHQHWRFDFVYVSLELKRPMNTVFNVSWVCW